MEGPIPEIKDRFPVQYFKTEVEKRKYKNFLDTLQQLRQVGSIY